MVAGALTWPDMQLAKPPGDVEKTGFKNPTVLENIRSFWMEEPISRLVAQNVFVKVRNNIVN